MCTAKVKNRNIGNKSVRRPCFFFFFLGGGGGFGFTLSLKFGGGGGYPKLQRWFLFLLSLKLSQFIPYTLVGYP